MSLGRFISLFWHYLNFVSRWLWTIYLLINTIDKDAIIIKEFEFHLLVKYILWFFFFFLLMIEAFLEILWQPLILKQILFRSCFMDKKQVLDSVRILPLTTFNSNLGSVNHKDILQCTTLICSDNPVIWVIIVKLLHVK